MSDFWLSLGRNEQQRVRAWNQLLRADGKFPCGECGHYVRARTYHPYFACLLFKKWQP